MENEHRENISDQFPHVQKKVLMLSEFAGEKGDVSDPIDKEIETYRQCARILTHLVQVAAEKMVKGAKNE
jgi:protein-tyrosine-phosphatase